MKYIYLAASVANGILVIVSLLFKRDILLANTHLILAVLFANWHKEEEERN